MAGRTASTEISFGPNTFSLPEQTSVAATYGLQTVELRSRLKSTISLSTSFSGLTFMGLRS